MMLKKTVCPYDCPASCGLLVETDGEKVYRITGDPEHPATHGVICAKMRGYKKAPETLFRYPGMRLWESLPVILSISSKRTVRSPFCRLFTRGS